MSTPGPSSSRPRVQVDPQAPANGRSQSPRTGSPQSAIIDVPPGWNGSPASGSVSGRGSMDVDITGVTSQMSASSLSSSSHSGPDAERVEPSPYANYVSARQDPFDTTKTFAEDPFAHPSDEERSSRHNSIISDNGAVPVGHTVGHGASEDGRRGSIVFIPHAYRSVTDPLMEEGHPLDTELTGQAPAQEGYELDVPQPPAFNRTFSAPLPQRVGYLRHPLSPVKIQGSDYNAHPPHRQSFSAVVSPITPVPPTARPVPTTLSSTETAVSDQVQTPLEAVSLELADGLQSAIQTLLHLSPPHLLDNAKEQYSGCTVQIPSTSLSALLSSMRGLNYLSANVQALCDEVRNAREDGILSRAHKSEDFDIGELLQSVADLLSGQAGQTGVDIVLFHGDVGIKHVSVQGDSEGLAYALGHVLRQILAIAGFGDTIELGLQIIPQSPSLTPKVSLPLTEADVDLHRRRGGGSSTRSSSPGRTLPSPPAGYQDGPLLCIFEIVHNLNQYAGSAAATPKAELNPFTHLKEQAETARPKLDTVLCRRLLSAQNASLRTDAQPSSPLGNGMPRRVYELSVLLPRGKPMVEPPSLSMEEEAMRQPFTGMKLAREPTLGELSDFADSLRGKKVTLHASLTSLFARHLTSYLAAWGLDISHIPIEEGDTAGGDLPKFGVPPAPQMGENGSYRTTSLEDGPSFAKDDGKFVIIDDDVAVLRRELTRIRAESPVLSFKPRLLKRPTLVNRTRSTPHVRPAATTQRQDGPVIIHFTSLSKYNQVRDIISSLLGSPSSAGSSAFSHPEVMVIPKPVGPRRFLTALHTAVNKPVVDPFFSPIATSPRSPGGGYFPARTPLTSDLGKDGGFFDSVAEEDHLAVNNTTQRTVSNSSGGSQKARSPLGEHPPSHASIVRSDAGLHLSIPTPGDITATPASEYFNTAASRGSSASGSAVIMQSPDGRPVGMFFEPPNKEGRRVSYNRHASERRKTATRRTSGAEQGESSQRDSPKESRRGSGAGSNDGKAPSRRGSMREVEGSTRASLRRKTLPTPAPTNAEPIIGVGRDRASTISLRRRNTQTKSPVQNTSASKDTIARPIAAPKLQKKAEVPDLNDVERIPGQPVLPAPAKKSGQDVVVPPINVLIVEDNPINQNILSMFLRKKKINHQTAKDGLEAVEKWRTGAFHLILMDIQLPVMDGIEATKEIRKLERSNNIGVFPSTPSTEPVSLSVPESNEPAPPSPFRSSVIIVALTASSLQSDRVTALAAGCNDFLTKPVSLKWLERKIIEWGCMQALIDFDGWKRWKGTGKDDTKQGFQVGPLSAARNIAGKLHIDRKSTRTPPPPSPQQASFSGPNINVRSATPQSSLDAVTSPTTAEPALGAAASSLSAARTDLVTKSPASAESAELAGDVARPAVNTPQTASRPLSANGGSERRSSRGSRPTTPRSEGRLSNSSSLKSIHEALEPPSDARASTPHDKPLPDIPSE